MPRATIHFAAMRRCVTALSILSIVFPLTCLGLTGTGETLPVPIESIAQGIADGRTLADQQRLTWVNETFNRLAYREDSSLWQVKDHWATPREFVQAAGGDCEDYALAKYFALRAMGIPTRQLRLTHVRRVMEKEDHMVLGYYADDLAEPLILDNLTDAILPLSERKDLMTIYTFNHEGLWLTAPGLSGKTYPPERISKWKSFLDKAPGTSFF